MRNVLGGPLGVGQRARVAARVGVLVGSGLGIVVAVGVAVVVAVLVAVPVAGGVTVGVDDRVAVIGGNSVSCVAARTGPLLLDINGPHPTAPMAKRAISPKVVAHFVHWRVTQFKLILTPYLRIT